MKLIIFLYCLIFALPLYAAKPGEVESKHPNLLTNFCGIQNISPEYLEKRYGKAQKVEYKLFKNIHTNLEDKIWKLSWKGSLYSMYEVVEEKRFLFLSAEINSNSFLPKPLIGKSKTEIIDLLGNPDESTNGVLTYFDKGMTDSDDIKINFNKNVVTSIECNSYVD